MDPVDVDEGLTIRPDGRPQAPVRRLLLDDWADGDPARAAARVRDSPALTIGIATRRPPERLRPLLEALTLTLAADPQVDASDRTLVPVPDPHTAFADLASAASRHPQASLALGQLLRQTPSLDTLQGLAAEAAVYSMLLGGAEFGAWLADRRATPAPATGHPLIRVDREGDRLSILLDRPQRRNAFSFRMREELYAALEIALLDDTVKEVELAGAGPVFCSGGDLAEFGSARDLVAAYLVRLDRAPWRLIDRMRERVTVRAQGAAVGAGIELAAFAGRVTASPETFFQLPELGMGLVPGAGGTVSVPRRIGRWRAAWMVLSGARIDADTALRWGLVDEVAQADEVDGHGR
ncbi:enoyl-CoA hydratase/isomerase family protein [Streptomyces sp. NPDC088794]|uniref:enoyl-CoA hydratase/isomerase family protein n=1 Tax=Streptomyces sp. NPDC088794 TaxID=3365902 RepID=UPI00381B9F88